MILAAVFVLCAARSPNSRFRPNRRARARSDFTLVSSVKRFAAIVSPQAVSRSMTIACLRRRRAARKGARRVPQGPYLQAFRFSARASLRGRFAATLSGTASGARVPASTGDAPPQGSTSMTSQTKQPPEAVGLYDPSFEHDACGVGMVARLDNQPTHEVIANATHGRPRMLRIALCT